MTQAALARAGALASMVALAVVLVSLPARADAPADRAAEVAAATAQAGSWLDALDAGRYDEGWSSLAAVMKQGRTSADWTEDITAPRRQFGKPVMRELQRADFSTSVRGAPTGNYVTASYLSQFSKAPPVLETVLLTREDGQWRIAGYSAGRAPDAPPAPAPADKATDGAAPGG